ncbi:MAG: porin family protein [Alphaproteobacteria bacterium]|nr:porin family protein [Alphaproteobacteria bacterium]
MKLIFKINAAALLMILSATAARAEAYIGGSLGSSAMVPTMAEDSISQWNATYWGPGNDCDTLGCYSEEETSGGLKFFAGYRVNPYFAVEGFIAYLGSFESYAHDWINVEAAATADLSTLGIVAVGMFPVSSRVSLLGKLGAHSWSAQGDIILADYDVATPPGYIGSYDTSGTDLMGGIGVQIDIGERAAMRVEFEYFAANTDYTEFGIGLFSVGGMFRF